MFNTMPYTNFHDLNIDWVLKVVKVTEETIANLEQTISKIVAEQLDDTVQHVNEKLAEIRRDMDAIQADVTQQLNEQNVLIDSKITQAMRDIQEKITELETYVNNQSVILRQEMNQLRDDTINMNDVLKQWVIEHTAVYDNMIRRLEENYTDALERALLQIQALFQQLNDNYHALYAELVTRLVSVRNEFAGEIFRIEMYIDAADQSLQEQIDRLKIGILPTQIINPATHITGNAQDVIDDMFYRLKCWALTAKQYNDLQLSAADYAAKNLTAYEYDYMAKWYLKIKPELLSEMGVRDIVVWSGSETSASITIMEQVPFFGTSITLIYDVNSSGVLTSATYNFIDTVDSLQNGAQLLYNGAYTPDIVTLTVQADNGVLKLEIGNAGATSPSPLVKVLMR